mgnify:FL=1
MQHGGDDSGTIGFMPPGSSEQRDDGEHRFAVAPVSPRELPDDNPLIGRLVVLLVLGVVGAIGAFTAAIGQFFASRLDVEPASSVDVGRVTLLVSEELPPESLIAIAMLSMVGIAASALALEAIAALMSVNPRRTMLSSHRPQLRRQSIAGDPVRVTVLIPAHNEMRSLPITLQALTQQTRPPDRIVVVADNCTDATVDVARSMGHEVFETTDNSYRKGGALNQALARLLPTSGTQDIVMVMDADTTLSSRFVEVGAAHMIADPNLTAVGGVFYGDPGHGLVGQFQRNEYARYALQIRARRGRVFVLTGTASMFRAEALLDVAAARGVFIPGTPGNVYDTAALTEDNELTLALKSLGGTMTSPSECRDTTEIMPTWRNLWVQRKRWQRGALENLSAYGVTRATIRYWGQQIGIGYGAIALNLALLLMLITFASVDEWIWYPFWVAIGVVFVTERVVTAWSGGWRARLLAALVLPELLYDVFLQIVFFSSLMDILRRRRAVLGHVKHVDAPVAT